MGAPIFTITTATASSVRQYFKWKSGEDIIYAVSGVDASVDHSYEYQGEDGTKKYYQSTTDATRWLVIDEYMTWEGKAYLCSYTGDMVGQNPDSYDDYAWYYDPSSNSNPFSSVMWVDNNPNTWGDPPSATTSTNGTGEFSYKLDDGAWSTDSTNNSAEITGLLDGGSHTLYIREKLVDASYTAEASQAFTVVFDSGSMKVIPETANISTDLTAATINFSFPDYQSRVLSGLTTDNFDLMGIWTYCGIKNGYAAYTKNSRYLWYDSNSNRWVMTQANYYDGTWSFDDYYSSFMYAGTGSAFPASGWNSGMEADMGQIAGTISWSSGVYAIMPIGSNIARYRVDAGAWIDLAQDAVTFDLVLELGNTYSVEIQEQLENGLYTDSAVVSIDCALIAAPTIGMDGGGNISDDGRNVLLQWSSNAPVAVPFNGVELQHPIIWDSENAVDYDTGKVSPQMPVADQSAPGSYCAVKLLPNTTYYMKVPEREGNVYNSVYKPDLSTHIAIHDNEDNWETIETGDDGGLWIYAVHDQGWGTWWKLAVKPTPEVITSEDIAVLLNLINDPVAGSGTFRYRVNSEVWSDDITKTEALQVFQLPTGDNLIEIEEKSSNAIWGTTGSFTLSITAGSETGGGSGITVPSGKYLVVLNPATGNEFLWDGVADISNLEPLTE